MKAKFLTMYFLLLCSLSVFAQSFSVRGVVKDKMGDPIIGATVQIKGKSDGAITGLDGEYLISNLNSNDILVFSFLGMGTKEIKVGNKSHIDVILEEDNLLIDEVVVVGYGVQKKSDVTGSLSSVDTDKMLAVPTTDIGKMLTGRVAGLEVVAADGRPGSTSSIRIRGTRSLSGGNEPLYVLDGVPVSDISSVNPSDIESVEVLKDASSTAIYGARAANGVVLVTTKRGKEGKTNVSFSMNHSIQSLKRNFDFFSPEEYVALQREKYRNADGTYPSDDVIFQPWELDNLKEKKYTDWEKLTINDALLSRYDLSINTGTEKSKVLFSLGYYNQEGMISNSGYKQFNMRLNADYEMFKNFKVGTNISYTYGDRDIEEEFIEGFLSLSPLNSPYDEDGNLVPTAGDGGQANPLWNNREYFNNNKKHQYLLNVFADWKFLPGLNYRINVSMDGKYDTSNTYRSSLHQTGSNTNGTGNISKGTYIDLLLENILSYNYKKENLGTMDLTLVQSANQIRNERLSVGATQFPVDIFGANGIGSALAPGNPSMSITQRRILSYMGRANFTILDRYLAAATLRIDGSSVFGNNNKWAYLPSVALGWLIHNEKFMSDFEWLSNAKLRFSYGQVGNQGVSPYQTLGVVSDYFYKFGTNEPSYSALPTSTLYNPNLRWEISKSSNIGFDLGLFNNRFTLTAEFYNTNTDDLIVRKSLNSSLGYSNMYDNLGKVNNKGVELTLHYDIFRERAFNWSMDMTFAKNKNTLVKISGEVDENGNPIDDTSNNWFIGKPINVYWDYKFAGIWQEGDDFKGSYMPDAEPGDIKVENVNNSDNEINSDDKIIYNKDPKFLASLSSNMTYKGFDLSFDFFLRYGGYRMNSNYGSALVGKGSNGMKVEYWTPENPSYTMPKPQQSAIPYMSTIQYQDATYFRLRNITLGYTIPANILKKICVTNLRVYASLSNYWTITKFKSYGPEHSAGSYPEPKTAQFGLNLSF